MNDQERLLTIFLRLQFGTPLGKKQLAQEFEVSEKTIQRDFSLLRDILSSNPFIKFLNFIKIFSTTCSGQINFTEQNTGNFRIDVLQYL